ncbi:hypothetical protein STEG23_009512, partial [Scotinomys teguina]
MLSKPGLESSKQSAVPASGLHHLRCSLLVLLAAHLSEKDSIHMSTVKARFHIGESCPEVRNVVIRAEISWYLFRDPGITARIWESLFDMVSASFMFVPLQVPALRKCLSTALRKVTLTSPPYTAVSLHSTPPCSVSPQHSVRLTCSYACKHSGIHKYLQLVSGDLFELFYFEFFMRVTFIDFFHILNHPFNIVKLHSKTVIKQELWGFNHFLFKEFYQLHTGSFKVFFLRFSCVGIFRTYG